MEQAIEVARGKAYVILDGSLLRIDRVSMTAKQDRPYYSGKHKCHGLNVQVLADPAGRLIWVSPTVPGGAARHRRRPRARHPRRHRHRRAAHRGRHRLPGRRPDSAGPAAAPPRRPRHRPLPPVVPNQKDVNTAHPRQRGPGERANAELKSWKISRKIRSSPGRATTLVKSVQTLILAG